jgi:hypothetical protein
MQVTTLARLARIDPELLCPVKHRGSGSPQFSFMHPCFIPQGKFYTILYSYLMVDLADEVFDNIAA